MGTGTVKASDTSAPPFPHRLYLFSNGSSPPLPDSLPQMSACRSQGLHTLAEIRFTPSEPRTAS
jgi:hypothetical protein